MNVVKLDARHWNVPGDFYKALLRKLGAPEWHGDNVAAIIDSMIAGGINEVGLPLRVVVTGLDRSGAAAFDELIKAFSALARYGAVTCITADRASLEIADDVSPFIVGRTRADVPPGPL
ncbi:MAG: barstar family protein [Sphingobium sp.]|jgi:RNAse (barnase) inhibitor barstar